MIDFKALAKKLGKPTAMLNYYWDKSKKDLAKSMKISESACEEKKNKPLLENIFYTYLGMTDKVRDVGPSAKKFLESEMSASDFIDALLQEEDSAPDLDSSFDDEADEEDAAILAQKKADDIRANDVDPKTGKGRLLDNFDEEEEDFSFDDEPLAPTPQAVDVNINVNVKTDDEVEADVAADEETPDPAPEAEAPEDDEVWDFDEDGDVGGEDEVLGDEEETEDEFSFGFDPEDLRDEEPVAEEAVTSGAMSQTLGMNRRGLAQNKSRVVKASK